MSAEQPPAAGPGTAPDGGAQATVDAGGPTGATPAAARPAGGAAPAAAARPIADPAAEARARLLRPRTDPVLPPRNGYAIASFVTSLLPFLGGGLFSIPFGIVALVQIRRLGERGKRLAIAGLAITGVHFVVLALLLVWSFIGSAPMRDDNGEVIRGGSIGADELRVGDCLEWLDVGLFDFPAVPCTEPHLAEVYAVFDYRDTWPGEATLAAVASRSCESRVPSSSPTWFDDATMAIRYAIPSRDSWMDGDRQMVCFVEFLDGTRTGPVLKE